MTGCRPGSMPTLWHTSLKRSAVISRTSLCRIDGKPPRGQLMVCSMLNCMPQTYFAGRCDGCRLDVVVESFWGRDRQRAFFDVRVFNPFAPTYLNTSLPQCYHRHEQAKSLRRESKRNRAWPSCLLYNRWHGANSNGCIQETSRSNLRETEERLQQTINWLRCRLSFSLLRSAIMCLRGYRSSIHHPARLSDQPSDIDLACHEGRIH